MKKCKLLCCLIPLALVAGCTSIERQAYNTIVASKAFLDSVKVKHPECPATTSAVCTDLSQATAAKDALIDAVEVYCSSKSFDTAGGECTPPNKTDPASQQITDKLQSAMSVYAQAKSDLTKAVN